MCSIKYTYRSLISCLNGKYEEALRVLAKAVTAGKFNQRFIEQQKNGYTKLKPGKDTDTYITKLKRYY